MSDTRYILRTTRRAIRCEDDVWAEPRERLDVIITEDHPVDTGLVDQNGTPIMRVSSRAPLGFCR